MASEYDALLEPSAQKKSEYDALLAPVPVEEEQPGILQKVGSAIGHVISGMIPTSAAPDLSAALPLPVSMAQQGIQLGQEVVEASKQPLGSQSQYNTLADVVFSVAPAVLPFLPKVLRLGEVAGIKSEPEIITPEPVAAEQAAKEVTTSATQERQIQEGIQPERTGDDTGRPSAEAGGGGGVLPATEVQKETVGGEPISEEIKKAEDERQGQEGRVLEPAAAAEPITAAAPPTGGVSVAAMAKRPITSPEGGEPVGWEQATAHGHDWLDKGGDPSKIIQGFRSNGKISTTDMGKMRAAMERIQAKTNSAGDALDKNPNDPALKAGYDEALKNEQTFADAYKPMHTVASNTLKSLQGQPPITEELASSYTGLNRRFIENMKRDFTPEESTKARQMSERTKSVSQDYANKTNDLYKTMDTEYNRIKGLRRPPTADELASMFSEPLKEVCDV